MAPRAAPVQAAAPHRSSPTALPPRSGGAQGAGGCPVGLAVGQGPCTGVGWHEGPCGTSPGSGSLWLFPHFAGAGLEITRQQTRLLPNLAPD